MKVWIVLCLVGALQLNASNLYSQQRKMDISMKDASLVDVFRYIRKHSGYAFVYDHDAVKRAGTVTVDAQGATVEEILEQCFHEIPFSYLIEDRVVIVQKEVEDVSQQQDVKSVVVKGRVIDEKKNPLPGVTVAIKGMSLGVVTDMEGNYLLRLPQEAKDVRLIFSFVGMKTQEVAYAGQPEIDITMHEEATQMDEVVITGYQVIDRRKNTSSVQTVKMDDIMVPGATTLDQMLEGRITDMMFLNNSGEVGVAPKIRIRGTSTLVGNREPLWVVDGIIVQDPVPISAAELNDPDYINRIGNAIAGLNPQDIERLDILKDAAATALYGTKAANGVIMITTKKGHIGAPVITYSMQTTLRQRPRYTDRSIKLMNSKERIQFSRELYNQHYDFNNSGMNLVGYEGLLFDLYNGKINEAEFANQVAKLETMNTDWFDLLTKDSWSHQHTVSISGGSEETRYYSSIGFSRDNDVIRGDYNQRYTASLNVESDLNSWLTTSFQLLGNVSRRSYYQDEISPMNYAYKTSRAIPAYDEDGEYAYYQKVISGSNSIRRNFNILNELENSYKDQHTSGITMNATLQFKFTDWLNAHAILSYSNQNAEIEGYWGEKTYHAASLRGSEVGENPPGDSELPFGGELTTSNTRTNSYTARLQLNANKYFGTDDQHNINASAGFEMSSSRYNGHNSTARGYYKDRGKIFVDNVNIEDFPNYGAWLASNVPVVSDNLTNILSGYATLSYSYYNYFTANVNARVDGSNKFGSQSNDKFLPIWSVSGNYNFSEHEFLKKDWIDIMSLKLSYGYQGNMLDSESPVMLIQKKPLDTYYGENVSTIYTNPNPHLKWEKTASFNAGLNLSFLQSKIQVEAEYYYKRTKDAFMTKEVATINGVNAHTINGGDIENQGYNVDLTVMPVKTKDWIWTLSTSFSKNYNKVRSNPNSQTYDYDQFLNGTVVVKDKAINTFYSYDFLGLSPVDGGPMFNDWEDQKHLLFGLSKYDTFTRVLKESGRREPYMSGGFNTNLRYRNIRLSAMFTYSLGAKTRLFRMFDDVLEPEYNVHSDFMKRWRNPGDEKYTDIPAIVTYNSSAYWKYKSQHFSDMYDNIQTFATDYYTMYDYSDARVVSANYLKCSSLTLTYEFGEKILSQLHMSRLALTLSGTNLFTVSSKKLNGQTPTQGGFSEIQLSERPTYTFGLSVSF